MTDIKSRLSRCFLNVFPDLPPAEVAAASAASLSRWDSVAHVTLLSAISEEFQFELDEDNFESLTSYQAALDFLKDQARE